MSDHISATHEYLLKNYGPLLTLKHLADVLHSTHNGLRMAITRKSEPFTAALAGTRRQIGPTHLFEAHKVVEIIDQVQAIGG